MAGKGNYLRGDGSSNNVTTTGVVTEFYGDSDKEVEVEFDYGSGSGNITGELVLPFITTLLDDISSGGSSFVEMPMLLTDYEGGGGENGSFPRTPIIFETVATNSTSTYNDVDSSDLYSSPATVFAILLTFSLCTILGNALVIIAVLREYYLKSPPNYFVASLAAADICVGILLVPFEAIMQLLNRRWIFGDVWCELWHSFDVLLSTASILNLCVISLDRYWAICTPMSYPRRMTTKRAVKFIALVWILAILISLPAIFWWRSVRVGEILPETCPFTEDVGYLIFSSCISFYIPLSVMLFAYYKIYKAAVKQSRSILKGTKLFSPKGKNGRGEMTLRMHRGGNGNCCNGEGPSSNTMDRVPSHRKSFSYGVTDQAGISLLKANNFRRADSVKVHGSKKVHGHRTFSESTCPHVELSPAVVTYDALQQQDESNDIPEECNDIGGIINDIATATTSDPDGDPSLLLTCSLPLNNNSRRLSIRSCQYVPTAPNPSSGIFRRPSTRRSFTVARIKLAKFAKEKKAAKTLAIVLGVFIICWLPFFVINIIFALCKSCAENHLKLFEVVTWLGWINSGMNPLIYACWSPDFRRAFAKLLGCTSFMRARQRRKIQRRLSVV